MDSGKDHDYGDLSFIDDMLFEDTVNRVNPTPAAKKKDDTDYIGNIVKLGMDDDSDDDNITEGELADNMIFEGIVDRVKP